jgi:cytochrome P450
MQEFLSPEYFQNPYPTYSEFHKRSPIFKSEKVNAWIVSPFTTVELGLHSAELNAGERITASSAHFSPEEREEFKYAIDNLNNWIVFQDAPAHTRLRKLVNKSFTPRRIAEIEPRVEEIVEELLDSALKEKRFDLVQSLSFKLPAIIICELLGIPEQRQADIRRWSDGVASLSASAQASREAATRANKAAIEAEQYLFGLFSELRKEPNSGLLSHLVNNEGSDDRLSDAEIAALTVQLFFAGFETTEGLISNMVVALSRNPDQFDILLEDVSLVPLAVEETLRFDSSIQKQSRVASNDQLIGDVQIRKGDYVHFMIGAANRDPNQFEDPDLFRILRKDINHVSFGHGIHFCIGAPLARLESKIAIQELVKRCGKFKVLTQQVKYPELFAVRKPLELLVESS